MEKSIREISESLGVKKYVNFKGKKIGEELIEEYNNSDIFILTSIPASYGSGEGQGVSLEEAGAMELPTIATNFAGLPEGMINGKTGLLVPIMDEKEIADKLIELLIDEKKRKLMGVEGRKFVVKKFGKSELSQKLKNIYKKLSDKVTD
jgi:colanic acid/amylovoran biosynthesis glycosyltransferase